MPVGAERDECQFLHKALPNFPKWNLQWNLKDGWNVNRRGKKGLSSKVTDSLKVKGENIHHLKKTNYSRMSFLVIGQFYSWYTSRGHLCSRMDQNPRNNRKIAQQSCLLKMHMIHGKLDHSHACSISWQPFEVCMNRESCVVEGIFDMPEITLSDHQRQDLLSTSMSSYMVIWIFLFLGVEKSILTKMI